MPRIEASIPGEDSSEIQLSAFDVGSMNAAEAHEGSASVPVELTLDNTPPDYNRSTGDDRELGVLGLNSSVGRASVVIADATSSTTTPRMCTPVTSSTSLDSPESVAELRHGNPLVAAGSEEDISDYLLGAICVVHQAGGPADPYSDSVPQPTSRAVKRSTTLPVRESVLSVLEQSISPVIEDPVTSPVEQRTPAVFKDLSTLTDESSAQRPTTSANGDLAISGADDLAAALTIPLPFRKSHTPRFFLPPFQRPTLLDMLIQRLQTKRVLVHTWRTADQCAAGQGAPPTRHRLENLDPDQIFEYIKSGGKSIDTPPHLEREKVTISPLRQVPTYGVQASSACGKPLMIVAARRKNSQRLRPSVHDTIAQLMDFVCFSVFCWRTNTH